MNDIFMSPQDVTIQVTDNHGTIRRSSLGRQRDDGFLMAPTADDGKTPPTTGHQQPNLITCHPISVMAYMKQNHTRQTGGRSYRGSRCQVCAWEMRSNVTKHVAFCSEHGIRMCTVHHPLLDDSPFAMALQQDSNTNGLTEWYCPDQSATCWQKGHELYIPLGVWGINPRIRYDASGCPKTISASIGSALYKKRSEWLVSKGLLESVPKSRGRKPKRGRHTLTQEMDLEVNHGESHNEEEDTFHECFVPRHSFPPSEEVENEI